MLRLLVALCGLGLAAGCLRGTALLPCLRVDLAAAIYRVGRSESVRLLPGLSLDRKAPPNAQQPSPNTEQPSTNAEPPSFTELYRSTERLFRSHSLFWNLVPGVDLTVSSDDNGEFQVGVAECHHRQERTFKFGMRRMKMILLPVMYKLGVITTLLTLLTVFALKGLTIGVLLLIMSTAGLVAKFKWAHHPGGYGLPPGGKEVHVHVHGGHASPAVYTSHPGHYDDWVREDRPRPGTWEDQRQPWGEPGVIQHRVVQQRLPAESTTSPWASYIGDHAI